MRNIMQKIEYVIIHCSDSSFGCADVIRNWHIQRGWKDIGYHYVILNGKNSNKFYNDSLNGKIDIGRPLDGDDFIDDNEIGAHALGYNKNSIGICIIGVDKFTKKQFKSLYDLVSQLISQHNININNILGHRETKLSHGKTCPNFNVGILRDILKNGYLDENLIPDEFNNIKI